MSKKINIITIVGSGEDYSPAKLKYYTGNSDLVIASDGGINALYECAIKPDIIIGDLDSAESGVLKKNKDVKIYSYPPEKDLTDSELALQMALEQKPKFIYMLGMTGSYLDHSLANVINLLKYGNDVTDINLVNGNSILFMIKNEKKFIGYKDRRISFFPLKMVKGLSMKGFKYIFGKKNISMNEYGISNVISEKKARNSNSIQDVWDAFYLMKVINEII